MRVFGKISLQLFSLNFLKELLVNRVTIAQDLSWTVQDFCQICKCPVFLMTIYGNVQDFCVHIMTIYGSVQFFLKNVCYVQDFFWKSNFGSKIIWSPIAF